VLINLKSDKNKGERALLSTFSTAPLKKRLVVYCARIDGMLEVTSFYYCLVLYIKQSHDVQLKSYFALKTCSKGLDFL